MHPVLASLSPTSSYLLSGVTSKTKLPIHKYLVQALLSEEIQVRKGLEGASV
jgi:hypothetical protein